MDFSNGRAFDSEGRKGVKFTRDKVLNAITSTGKLFDGEVLLLPGLNEISHAMEGITHGAFYHHADSYEEVIAHVTGLTVMRHKGLVVLGENTQPVDL